MNARLLAHVRLESIENPKFLREQQRHNACRALEGLARHTVPSAMGALGIRLEEVVRHWLSLHFPLTDHRLLYYQKSGRRGWEECKQELDAVLGTPLHPQAFVEVKVTTNDRAVGKGMAQVDRNRQIATLRWPDLQAMAIVLHLFPQGSEWEMGDFDPCLPPAFQQRGEVQLLNLDALDLWRWGRAQGIIKDPTLLHRALDDHAAQVRKSRGEQLPWEQEPLAAAPALQVFGGGEGNTLGDVFGEVLGRGA